MVTTSNRPDSDTAETDPAVTDVCGQVPVDAIIAHRIYNHTDFLAPAALLVPAV